MQIVFLESAEFTYATLRIWYDAMSRFSALAATDREAPIATLASVCLSVCLSVCMFVCSKSVCFNYLRTDMLIVAVQNNSELIFLRTLLRPTAKKQTLYELDETIRTLT
jgi:hypothetical protein